MERVLDASVHVFCERGFHGTSIADLTAATGLTGGSLYKAFADKDAMYLAAVEHQSSQRNAQLQQVVDAAESGRDKVRAALEFYADLSTGATGREGCLVVETAVGIDALDERAAAYARRAMEQRRTFFSDLIALGKADGSIPHHVETSAVSAMLLNLVQGMRVVGKTDPSREAVASVVRSALMLLN